MASRSQVDWMVLCVVGSVLLLSASFAYAQTQVFVQNDTPYDLNVDDIKVSGDKISKAAWKRGVSTIPRGQRGRVLSLNRSGKVNWMDPTPRFIEPGKTAVFTTLISIEGRQKANAIKLKQKLFGTGKSSRMWHSLEGATNQHQWHNNDKEQRGIWELSGPEEIQLTYRTFLSNSDTHIEYIFGGENE